MQCEEIFTVKLKCVVKLPILALPMKMFLCRPCSSFTSSQFLLFLQIQIARDKGKIGFKNLDSFKLHLVQWHCAYATAKIARTKYSGQTMTFNLTSHRNHLSEWTSFNAHSYFFPE